MSGRAVVCGFMNDNNTPCTQAATCLIQIAPHIYVPSCDQHRHGTQQSLPVVT